MAQLTATVKSQRVVSGEYKTGKRQGEEWEFLSLELIDVSSGFIWNCQLPSEDDSYRDATKDSMVGHRVRVKVTSQTAGQRDLPDGTKKMQIRSQVTNLRDMGIPKEDE